MAEIPSDVSDTLEKVHPSISASALDVMVISGDEIVAREEGVRIIWVSVNEPVVAEKSELESATGLATPVREKEMEVNVTLVAEQTKMSSEIELTNFVTLASLDG